MECNPATVSREDLLAWRRLGVNRLSIGAQSMVPQELSALGRAHGCEDVIATVRAAREAGFDNISLDVMYGIPHQTAESFAYTLDALIALSPEHVSAYCLKIEEGTRFYACRDTLPLPDEDTVCDMYSEAARRLAEYGLVQYEISNFSKPGRESRHNLKYWRGEAYLGFGAAAHSYFEKERFWAPEDIDLYEQGVFRAGHEPIDEEQTFAEYIMLRLRLREGIAYEAFGTRFGKDFRALFSERLRPFAERGLVVMDEERCYLTVEGMFLSNAILVELLDF